MNKCLFLAKVGKKIEINGKVGVLNVAVKRDQKNEDGSYTSDWFRVKVFGKTIDVIDKYVGVGDTLMLECRVQNNNWTDKDNIKHYDIDFLLQSFEFVSKCNPQPKQPQQTQNQYNQVPVEENYNQEPPIDPNSEQLPF